MNSPSPQLRAFIMLGLFISLAGAGCSTIPTTQSHDFMSSGAHDNDNKKRPPSADPDEEFDPR